MIFYDSMIFKLKFEFSINYFWVTETGLKFAYFLHGKSGAFVN